MTLELLVAGACVLAAGIGWLRDGARRAKRKLLRAPRLRIADAPENAPIRIVGVARSLDAPIAAPFSGRPCLAYSVAARGLGDRALIEHHTSHAVTFVVEDESGRAIVHGHAAEIVVATDHSEPSGIVPSQHFEQLFGEHHDPTERLGLDEGIIVAGQRVAVLGAGTRELDPERAPTSEGGYRDAVAGATQLVLASSARFPLMISTLRDTLEA